MYVIPTVMDWTSVKVAAGRCCSKARVVGATNQARRSSSRHWITDTGHRP